MGKIRLRNFVKFIQRFAILQKILLRASFESFLYWAVCHFPDYFFSHLMVWVVCVRGGVQPPRPLLRLLPLPHVDATSSGALANVAADARSLRFPAKHKDFLVGDL